MLVVHHALVQCRGRVRHPGDGGDGRQRVHQRERDVGEDQHFLADPGRDVLEHVGQIEHEDDGVDDREWEEEIE